MPDLLEDLRFGTLTGDGFFHADWLVGETAAVPSRRNRSVPRDHDREMHGWRH
ncbi:MAG: hypothetical protein OXC66_05110 [Roseovarius sp.]|nr:hypothetical protein [Roseovarius sp.]